MKRFGRRVTLFWFGWDVRLARTYLCVHWPRGFWWAPWRWYVYLSPDATPPWRGEGRYLFGHKRSQRDT